MKFERVTSHVGLKLSENLKDLDKKVGRVGWLQKKRYKKGTKVAYVAAIQEYGSPRNNIPPRPFLRPTIVDHQKEWKDVIAKGSKAVLNNKITALQVMEQVGQLAKSQIQAKISTIYSPPLKPHTIQARLNKRSNKKKLGSLDKPLIDTGILYGTITNTVKNK